MVSATVHFHGANVLLCLLDCAERRAMGAGRPSRNWKADFAWNEQLVGPETYPVDPLVALLAGMRFEGRLTDATLVCGGEEVLVHSLVLVPQSSFFQALLVGEFARRASRQPAWSVSESAKRSLPRIHLSLAHRPDRRYVIEDLTADTCRTVVDFAYCAVLPQNQSMAALALRLRPALHVAAAGRVPGAGAGDHGAC